MFAFAHLLANAKLIAVLLAVNVLTSGGAYLIGRSDGRAAERAAGLVVAIEAKKRDEIANAQQSADNIAEIERDVNRELTNDEIETLLLRPSNSGTACALDGEFLHDLKRLQ